MTEITTVSGKTYKLQGRDWDVRVNGLLVFTHPTGNKMVFAAGQWESVREMDK